MRLSNMMKFYIAMDDKPQKQIAYEIGIGPSTLQRLIAGRNIDQYATLRVIGWLFNDELEKT